MKWDSWVSVLLVTATLVFGILTFLASPAHSHFHDKKELNEWVSKLVNRQGTLCCSLEDGVLLTEPDWDSQNKERSHYKVHWTLKHTHDDGITDYGWLDVPDEVLVDGPNLAGHALVWVGYSMGVPYVKCFMPGALT